MAYGKMIELFLVNGTADSIVKAELSNWNGMAIKIPRIEITTYNNEDISQPGVYFLFCKNDEGADSVYIGEAEDVKERLLQHLREYQYDKEKYYWNTAVIFVGHDLNKALIRYLENQLVELAKSCKRYTVLTKNTYRNTVLKESQIAAMEEFIDNIKIVINALGYKVLDPLVQQTTKDSETLENELLYTSGGNVSATGIVTSEGFVVLKGSTIKENTSKKSLSPSMKKLRETIMSSDKVENFTTTEDILFSSSSAASDFVYGYNISGPQTWKTKDGRTLKEIEAAATD